MINHKLKGLKEEIHNQLIIVLGVLQVPTFGLYIETREDMDKIDMDEYQEKLELLEFESADYYYCDYQDRYGDDDSGNEIGGEI